MSDAFVCSQTWDAVLPAVAVTTAVRFGAKSVRRVRKLRALCNGASLIGLAATSLFTVPTASAQTATPNLVSACSGVSLPRSVVTDILRPVINGVVDPIQSTVNPIVGSVNAVISVPLISALVSPLTVSDLNINATGLLDDAAAGDPITLQVLNANGTVVGPADRCDTQADSFSLRNPAGIAIGGNRITGLGSNGLDASAGEANSVAFGNSATTAATAAGAIAFGTRANVGVGATGAMALGTDASATAVNSVALGANSLAARAPQTGYTAIGLAAAQNSAGEVSVGSVGAERQITNVAAGTAATDAANVGQLAGVQAQIGTLASGAVQYDGPAQDRVTLAGPAGTTIGNLAPGALGAGSTEAINGSQLFATNTTIANLTTNITNGAIGALQYSNAATPTMANGGVPSNDVTLVGGAAGSVAVHNVGNGVIAVGSTDAVNGGQLATVSGQVGNLAALSVQYDDATRTRVTLGGAGALPVALGNVAAGTVAAGSTDAVNGSQLNATNVQVANNTTAITNLGNQVANGGTGPVQYSNPGSTTTPNGGTRTNDLTLVGAAAGPVGLHNVAGGAIAAGSTDAVNGGQVYALALTAVNAVSYDTDATGARTNTVTLAGGTAAAPVAVGNVAAGTLAAGSTQAVNGGQLYTTNQAVVAAQGTADSALALGGNSVQYGASRTNVTFNAGGSATVLSNVAAGISTTDAVNVGQLNAGLNAAVNDARAYTDGRIAALNFDVRSVRKDSYAGTSGALAAAGLPQAYEPGKGMIAIGGGAYGSQSAVAVGVSKAFSDGHTVMKFGGTYDSQGKAGASGGIGYQF